MAYFQIYWFSVYLKMKEVGKTKKVCGLSPDVTAPVNFSGRPIVVQEFTPPSRSSCANEAQANGSCGNIPCSSSANPTSQNFDGCAMLAAVNRIADVSCSYPYACVGKLRVVE